jgi:hypothetical protein
MPFGRIAMRCAASLAAILCVAPAGEALAACYDRVDGVQRRFILDGGEAHDTKTNLTWKRCSLGMAWDGKGCAGEQSFKTLAEAVATAKISGSGWRVPSGPELQSIVDRSCGQPVVDQIVFPDIAANAEGVAEYWTTNPVGVANLIYFFDFITGDADGHSPSFHLAVRLVKSGD